MQTILVQDEIKILLGTSDSGLNLSNDLKLSLNLFNDLGSDLSNIFFTGRHKPGIVTANLYSLIFVKIESPWNVTCLNRAHAGFELSPHVSHPHMLLV